MKDQFVKTFYVSKIQMALQPTGGTAGTNSVTLPKFSTVTSAWLPKLAF